MYLLMILMNEGTGKFLGETLSQRPTYVGSKIHELLIEKSTRLLVTFSATYSL